MRIYFLIVSLLCQRNLYFYCVIFIDSFVRFIFLFPSDLDCGKSPYRTVMHLQNPRNVSGTGPVFVLISQPVVHILCRRQNTEASNQCISQACGFKIFWLILSHFTQSPSKFSHYFPWPVCRVFLPLCHKLYTCWRIQLCAGDFFCGVSPPIPKAKSPVPEWATQTQHPGVTRTKTPMSCHFVTSFLLLWIYHFSVTGRFKLDCVFELDCAN